MLFCLYSQEFPVVDCSLPFLQCLFSSRWVLGYTGSSLVIAIVGSVPLTGTLDKQPLYLLSSQPHQ